MTVNSLALPADSHFQTIPILERRMVEGLQFPAFNESDSSEEEFALRTNKSLRRRLVPTSRADMPGSSRSSTDDRNTSTPNNNNNNEQTPLRPKRPSRPKREPKVEQSWVELLTGAAGAVATGSVAAVSYVRAGLAPQPRKERDSDTEIESPQRVPSLDDDFEILDDREL